MGKVIIIGTTKSCSTCKLQKDFTEFYKETASKTGLTSQCRDCINNWRREHRAKPLTAKQTHRLILKRRFGPDFDYDLILFEQGGVCASCGADNPGKGFTYFLVDHDHACCPGKNKTCGNCIRGLVCNNCNTGFGCFKDDPKKMVKASKYILRYLRTKSQVK